MAHGNNGYSSYSVWERIKRALVGDDAESVNEQVLSSRHILENYEQALRFGYRSAQKYGATHPRWGDDIDSKLRSEYPGDYLRDRANIRHAYEFSRCAN